MFSGIIQATGKVVSVEHIGTTLKVRIQSPISSDLKIDQSISHDGVCLTVTQVEQGIHDIDIVRETQSKTTFEKIRIGQTINLEKSLTLQSLLDGHLVQGHVDTTLTCTGITDENGSWKFRFNLPAEFASLVILHGSICLNGVSLTIANLYEDALEVAIIPYTFSNTNFHDLNVGDKVNVEFDLIEKYLLRQQSSALP